jgi:CheY-like chemotaxis protein/predicted transcriptional regulator
MPRQSGDSFSSPVIGRMLRILLENGELKKSNLCSKAGLNYNVCSRYISFLGRLHWIQVREDSNHSVLVRIPQDGIEILRKLEAEGDDEVRRKMVYDKVLESQAPSSMHKHRGDQSGSEKREKKDPGRVIEQKAGSDNNKKKRKRVIIVDDDENSLFTYKSFLESDKLFKVTVFSDPRSAFEYITLHASSIDLIVLDIRMPNLSGLRVFQGVKALNPKANIIFLSSLDAAPEISEIFSDARNGASNFLRKPVNRANFIRAVRKAVLQID